MDTLILSKRVNSLQEGKAPSSRVSWDNALFFLLLIFSNLHLLTGQFSNSLIYFPSSIRTGEFWRLITYPFVHVSWYHLLLDGGAFFLLYQELNHVKAAKRIFYVIICGAFSLIAVNLTSPQVGTYGLCGLSGIAHGLMVISALGMIGRKENVKAGLLCLVIVVSKSIYEAFAGDVLLSFLHFDLCGTPLVVSHAGGVLGGLVAYHLCGLRIRNA
jgi:rhomboid family GlyGly-CTERM serine protease